MVQDAQSVANGRYKRGLPVYAWGCSSPTSPFHGSVLLRSERPRFAVSGTVPPLRYSFSVEVEGEDELQQKPESITKEIKLVPEAKSERKEINKEQEQAPSKTKRETETDRDAKKLPLDKENQKRYDSEKDRPTSTGEEQKHEDGPKVHFILHDQSQDTATKTRERDQELKHRKGLEETEETDEEEESWFFYRRQNNFDDRSQVDSPHHRKISRAHPPRPREEELSGIALEDIDLILSLFSLDNSSERNKKFSSSDDRPLLVVDTGSYNKELEKCFQGLLPLYHLTFKAYALSNFWKSAISVYLLLSLKRSDFFRVHMNY